MNDREPRNITRSVWYGKEDISPELPSGRFGIDFILEPATGPLGDTFALIGTVRLCFPYTEMYGARAGAATEVVAMNKETGQVYHMPASRLDSAPFEPVILTPEQMDGMDAVVDEINANFNVDLCAHLGLPQEYGVFYVFCWMDHMKSGMKTVDVPASDLRSGSSIVQPRSCSEQIISITKADDPLSSRSSVSDGIHLEYIRPTSVPKDADKQPEIEILGRVDPNILPDAPLSPDDPPLWLTIFIRSHLDRDFAYCTIPVPSQCIEDRSLSFQFNPFRLLDSIRPQQYFILVSVGDVLSDVLTVEPDIS